MHHWLLTHTLRIWLLWWISVNNPTLQHGLMRDIWSRSERASSYLTPRYVRESLFRSAEKWGKRHSSIFSHGGALHTCQWSHSYETIKIRLDTHVSPLPGPRGGQEGQQRQGGPSLLSSSQASFFGIIHPSLVLFCQTSFVLSEGGSKSGEGMHQTGLCPHRWREELPWIYEERQRLWGAN